MYNCHTYYKPGLIWLATKHLDSIEFISTYLFTYSTHLQFCRGLHFFQRIGALFANLQSPLTYVMICLTLYSEPHCTTKNTFWIPAFGGTSPNIQISISPPLTLDEKKVKIIYINMLEFIELLQDWIRPCIKPYFKPSKSRSGSGPRAQT